MNCAPTAALNCAPADIDLLLPVCVCLAEFDPRERRPPLDNFEIPR